MQSFNRLPTGLGLPGSLDPSAGAPAANWHWPRSAIKADTADAFSLGAILDQREGRNNPAAPLAVEISPHV